MTEDICFDIINFFVWIKSSFGLHEVSMIATLINVDKNELYGVWNTSNEINFFFNLSDDGQKHIIEQYREHIDDFNKYLKNKNL